MKMQNTPQRAPVPLGKRLLHWLCILAFWTALVLMASAVQAQEEPLVIDHAPAASYAPSALEDFPLEVLALVNAERRSAGCEPLANNTILAQVAYGHSEDMARNGYFDHVDLNGGKPWDRAYAAGYPQNAGIGENIAAGYPDPQDVVNAWMNSPGHRANILRCAYNESGVGVYLSEDSDDYGIYWTHVFGSNPNGVTQPPTQPIDGNQARVYLPLVSVPQIITTTCTNPQCVSDENGAALLAMLNQRRADAGCSALTPHAILGQVAYDHAKDMADHDYLDYLDRSGETPWGRAKAAGYFCTPGHTGLVAWEPGLRTPADAFDYYMTSGSSSMILDCSYKHVGIGMYENPASDHGYYWMVHLDSGTNYN